MYYIMLEFRFLYVGLIKTTKNIIKLVRKKKLIGKKTRNFKLLDQSNETFL